MAVRELYKMRHLFIAHLFVAHYGLRDEMALHMVRGFRSLVHGFVSLEVAGGFGLPLDLDKSFRLLIQGYIQMLSAQMHHA